MTLMTTRDHGGAEGDGQQRPPGDEPAAEVFQHQVRNDFRPGDNPENGKARCTKSQQQ